jgi:hypothetical protein
MSIAPRVIVRVIMVCSSNVSTYSGVLITTNTCIIMTCITNSFTICLPSVGLLWLTIMLVRLLLKTSIRWPSYVQWLRSSSTEVIQRDQTPPSLYSTLSYWTHVWCKRVWAIYRDLKSVPSFILPVHDYFSVLFKVDALLLITVRRAL